MNDSLDAHKGTTGQDSTKPKRRRRHDYSPEIADLICDRIAGGASLRQICQDANMPAKSTIFVWLEEHEDFASSYTLARQIQIEDLVDEILEIADDSSNDWIDREGPDVWQSKWLARIQPLSQFSPGSEVAEAASGGWLRLHLLRLVSCGRTLGTLRPFAACVTAVISTSGSNMSTSMRGDKRSSETSALKPASVRSWLKTRRWAMIPMKKTRQRTLVSYLASLALRSRNERLARRPQ